MSMVHFDPSIGTVKESVIRDLKMPRNRCTGNRVVPCFVIDLSR